MAIQGPNGISWTGRTWNAIAGCMDDNADCRHCYAKRLAATRLRKNPKYIGLATMSASGVPKWTGEVSFSPDTLLEPFSWKKPDLVFVDGMSDLWFEGIRDDIVDQHFAVMMLAHRHTYQVLTKRADRMAAYFAQPDVWDRIAGYIDLFARQLKLAKQTPIPAPPFWHIWLGVSAGHQEALDSKLPHLVHCRPWFRTLWLSAEPLTSHVPLQWKTVQISALDWVVAGGEKTKADDARPMWPSVVRQLRDDAVASDVPFHLKQWGTFAPAGLQTHPIAVKPQYYSSTYLKEWLLPGGETMRAGVHGDHRRVLDGVVWDQYPKGAGR